MTAIKAPAVYRYRDHDHHARVAIAAIVGRSYVTYVPMDTKLSVEKVSLATFEHKFTLLDNPPAKAAQTFLKGTEYLPITGGARRLLEKIAAGSDNVTEDDLYEEVATQEAEMADETKTETTKKASKAKAEKAPKAEKTAKAPKEKGEAAPSTIGGFAPNAKIKVLNKENPHREGSGRHAAFESARAAKTVADYTGKPKYLGGWVESGHLQIG